MSTLERTDKGGAEALVRMKGDWTRQALARGLLTEADRERFWAQAQQTHQDLGALLVQAGKLTEEQLAQLMADAAAVIYMDVLDYQVDAKVLKRVPEHIARKHTVLPLFCVGNALTVAISDPWNLVALDEVRLCAKLPIVQPVVSTAAAIRKAIDRHYGRQIVEQAARIPGAGKPSEPANGVQPANAGVAEVSDVSVSKLVDALLSEALEARASDIHLEPDERQLRVRFRIDGVLHEVKLLQAALQEPVVSRIKLLAKLDITEHRLPQDGHLPLTLANRLIDLRISTYPTVFGENVVIRLLDHESLTLKLDELGFGPAMLQDLVTLIGRPHGMLLVTGPTGSGKTTTLYGVLSHINSMTKNIVTIEDPVEYRLPLIRQTQVNPKAGVTFANGLRSLLRQDPDVIMVGEIRDQETAEIAIHAALTGHLVLSTLHTNDAVGAVARLLDMKVEPFLLSSTLLGVVAQRLVRRICTHCQESTRPTAEMRAAYPQLTAFFRGRGCRFCHQGGFTGRVGIFELFRVDDTIRELISHRRSSTELLKAARIAGMQTMRQDGLLKVQQGLTTLEELDRMVPAEVAAARVVSNGTGRAPARPANDEPGRASSSK